MADSLGEAVVKLIGDLNPLKSDLGQAKGLVKGSVADLGGIFQGGLGTVLKFAGGIAGFAGVTAGITDVIRSGMDAQVVGAQLNQVIESTGGVAGVSADYAQALASGLQDVTRYEDDAIVSGENLLLTFTNIGRDIFPEATETMLDMSTALGQDLKASAVQVGKALNDPIQGVTALSKVGVNFSDAQKATIKSLVESNRALDAQKLILQELQTEFGGSAVAAGSTFAGQLDILQNRLGGLKDTVGLAFIDILQPLVEGLNQDVLPEIERFVNVLFASFGEVGQVFDQLNLAGIWQSTIETLSGGKGIIIDVTTVARELGYQIGALGVGFVVMASDGAAAFGFLKQVIIDFVAYADVAVQLQINRWSAYIDSIQYGALAAKAALSGQFGAALDYARDAKLFYEQSEQAAQNYYEYTASAGSTWLAESAAALEDLNRTLEQNKARGDTLLAGLAVRRAGGQLPEDRRFGGDQSDILETEGVAKASAKRVGTAWGDALSDGTQAAKQDANSFFESALNDAQTASKGLLNLMPGGDKGPNAPGAGGFAEDMFRLQAWIKDGSWGDVAAKRGIQTKEEATKIVQEFQQGLLTDQVKAFLNIPLLVSQAQTAELAETLRTQFVKDLAAGSGAKQEVIGALLGMGGYSDQAIGKGQAQQIMPDLGPLVPSILTGFDKQLADNAEALKERGRQTWTLLGAGLLEEATASGVLYRAVESMVLNVLATELQ